LSNSAQIWYAGSTRVPGDRAMVEMVNNNNYNNLICKAPECQKTSVALKDFRSESKMADGTQIFTLYSADDCSIAL